MTHRTNLDLSPKEQPFIPSGVLGTKQYLWVVASRVCAWLRPAVHEGQDQDERSVERGQSLLLGSSLRPCVRAPLPQSQHLQAITCLPSPVHLCVPLPCRDASLYNQKSGCEAERNCESWLCCTHLPASFKIPSDTLFT